MELFCWKLWLKRAHQRVFMLWMMGERQRTKDWWRGRQIWHRHDGNFGWVCSTKCRRRQRCKTYYEPSCWDAFVEQQEMQPGDVAATDHWWRKIACNGAVLSTVLRGVRAKRSATKRTVSLKENVKISYNLFHFVKPLSLSLSPTYLSLSHLYLYNQNRLLLCNSFSHFMQYIEVFFRIFSQFFSKKNNS